MDGGVFFRRIASGMALLFCFVGGVSAFAQNFERYRPFDPTESSPDLLRRIPEIPDLESNAQEQTDDRVLVDRLDAVIIVDSSDKIRVDASIDDLEGIEYDFDAKDSIVFGRGVRGIVERSLGQPITLRRVNQLAADIIKQYRNCKQPIVDIQIPEQRITGGTIYLVVIESRVDRVLIQHGEYFSCDELSRWIRCTRPGERIYEPALESDLLWLNQNPFRRVTVDFEKGRTDGTTEVIFNSREVLPLRGYLGADDTGVESLNYGRLFAGFTYGNLWNYGGILSYQYTADQEFLRLHAHSLSYLQPLSREWSTQAYGSWAGVTPELSAGMTQNGESWQVGSALIRHLARSPYELSNFTAGWDFKSTNNNLEFSGTTIANSVADLFQLRFEYDHLAYGGNPDEYRLVRMGTFIGPGSGLTGMHSTTAFNAIRPGTSPDYIYGQLRLERAKLLGCSWQMQTRFTGQVASERLLFSEMLGLGGFDSIRGFDQRSFNADHGWIANFEFGPRPIRGGTATEPSVFRWYSFLDLGNGYLEDPLAGEDAETFVVSTGVGARYQMSNRLIARFDYGLGLRGINESDDNQRIHFGLTWIPGPRP